MHSDLLEDQAEARLIELRRQRLRQQKAEKGDSQNTSVSTAGYVTDAIKTAVVPMPGMSFLTAQTAENVYATTQLSMGPAGGQPVTAASPGGRAEVRQRSAFVAALCSWMYRAWLIGATTVLTLALFELQAVLDHVHRSLSIWRTLVQWAELSWLSPVPLALILWLGWLLFAECVRGNPAPIDVPTLAARTGLLAFAPKRPVRLVFRLVTRGENVAVLRESVSAIHRAFMCYPCATGPYRIEIVTEHPLTLLIDPRTRIYVVPRDYVTPQRSQFKARALAYLQSQVRPGHEDWLLYLDEESLVDEHLLAGLYRFVRQTLQDEMQPRNKRRPPAGVIGQGSILYQG